MKGGEERVKEGERKEGKKEYRTWIYKKKKLSNSYPFIINYLKGWNKKDLAYQESTGKIPTPEKLQTWKPSFSLSSQSWLGGWKEAAAVCTLAAGEPVPGGGNVSGQECRPKPMQTQSWQQLEALWAQPGQPHLPLPLVLG